MKTRDLQGFSLVELMAVIAVIGVIIALVMPSLRNMRESAGETQCASNLRQLGQATLSYLAAYKDHLPQVAAFSPMSGEQEIIGSLFGGKRGTLPMFGINEYGADKRPLNKFLSLSSVVDTDASDGIQEEMPVFQCPLDRGQPAQPPFVPHVDEMYEFVGTSYTLNDHTLNNEACWTLVPRRTPWCHSQQTAPPPRPGGRMPRVDDATKTWMLADLPIYNYQEGGDRRQHWHFNRVQCNLCFVDGHVASGIEIPEGIVHTTKSYTFLPTPNWLDQAVIDANCNCGSNP